MPTIGTTNTTSRSWRQRNRRPLKVRLPLAVTVLGMSLAAGLGAGSRGGAAPKAVEDGGGSGGDDAPTIVVGLANNNANSEGVGVKPLPRVNVYVYDHPMLADPDIIDCYREINGVPPWQDERTETAQNVGEVWMHQALLRHPWRVLDPEDADLFYVPLYPVVSFLLHQNAQTNAERKCRGRGHHQRMQQAVRYLEEHSPYFKRYGGADHVIVCVWWNCRSAIGSAVRMRLAHAIIGNDEDVPWWIEWGCLGRVVAVPYCASSVATKAEVFGGRAVGERDIPFFFVGTGRKRQERQTLEVQYRSSLCSTYHRMTPALAFGCRYFFACHILRTICRKTSTRSSNRCFVSNGANRVTFLNGVLVWPKAVCNSKYYNTSPHHAHLLSHKNSNKKIMFTIESSV